MIQASSLICVGKKLFFMVGMLLIITAVPQTVYAAAAPIVGAVDWVLDLLTNQIARSVAIIAIVVLGYMAWAGRLTWERAISFIVGIVLIFGAAAIVDAIIGVAGA